MDLHAILYSNDPHELQHVQLVINAAELRQCFLDQEKWIKETIREATEPQYYTREELANRLHVSLPTIDRNIENGKLPKPVRHGRRVLFNKADVNYHINHGNFKK